MIASEGVYYNSMLKRGVQTGRFKKKLLSLREGILLTLVEHLASGEKLLFANTHIHWDPSYPHVKAQQCAFAYEASKTFLEKHMQTSDKAVPLIFTGDFNTVPFFQEIALSATSADNKGAEGIAIPSGGYGTFQGLLRQDHPGTQTVLEKLSSAYQMEDELQEAAMSVKN